MATLTNTIHAKALIGAPNNTAMQRPTLGDYTIPFPSASSIEPMVQGAEHLTLNGTTRKEVTSRKYKYTLSWDYINVADYTALEAAVNNSLDTATTLIFRYGKWPQSAPGVEVIADLSSRELVYGTGANQFLSSVTLTLTEVNSRI